MSQPDPRVLLPGQNPKLDHAFDLGELLWVEALRRHMFLEVVLAHDNVASAVRRGWAGGREPETKSCALAFARLKGLELVTRAPNDRMTVGPTDDVQSSGFKGGVRYEEMVLAASAQADDEDLMCALLMAMPRAYLTPTLHHVGFAYASLDEMVEAVNADEAETGNKSSWPEASDLLRAYTWRPVKGHIREGFYVERIFRPVSEGTPEVSAHLDLLVHDPMGVLVWVGGHLGVKPEVFDPGWENGPKGFVFVEGRDMPIGIMTRSSWWEIPMVARPEHLRDVVDRILAR
jgi:hypothetical protein